MAKLGSIDLGIVTDVDYVTTQSSKDLEISGETGTFSQTFVSNMQQWRIMGLLNNPTSAQIGSLRNLATGEVILIDIAEYGLFGYGKVIIAPRVTLSENMGDVWNYQFEIKGCPAIGKTRSRTGGVVLHDLDYRMSFDVFDPHIGKFSANYDSTRMLLDYGYYVDNDNSIPTDALIETGVGDTITEKKVWGWKSAAWVLIGDWGNADAWDAIKAFTDDNSVAHNFRVNTGIRGQILAMGTVSMDLGCKTRTLMSITNLSGHSGTDLSTRYGASQLLLKVQLLHGTRESLRPYSIITYVDGSVGRGVA